MQWDPLELEAWLRLSLTPGVGNAASRRLLTRFGSASAIFKVSVAELQSCVTLAQAAQLRHPPDGFAQTFETTWRWLHQAPDNFAHALIVLGDARYPESLLHTEDPPLMLYAVGAARWLVPDVPLTQASRSLAVVGSRNPTPQGKDNAYQFARSLAASGWCIVSGMALGVDAAAHEGALSVHHTDVPTIAVIGTGIDRVYPRQNKQLAHQLASNAVVLSEFPLGTPPIASNFPKRNRIISGLSCGTLVVEAALASGSLITARTASEQGREVFAIPGSIHSPQSRGCHALIQQGAKLVTCAQDILDELQGGPQPTHHPAPSSTDAAPATPVEAAPHSPLLQAMGYEPVSWDALAARTGWSAPMLQAQLLELELQGSIARLPGGMFQRCAQA